ncbi:MAG TPA: IS1182 family transposase [Geminicoccaceae bacterium]|nr:IS1182 family transposase [Geminicoccaceae bacterium]
MLKPSPIEPVPEGTARVAKAAFRKGNPLLSLRDELGAIFADADFADLFPGLGQPGLPPWRLALVTLLQFRENLPDRQAAEAVRARIDWKYLLGLELADPGFDHSVLCEFRSRLLEGSAEERLLHKLLEACQARGLLKARGRQRTDATHVLASIRVLNRLELLGETLRATLNEIAAVAPDWLRTAAPRAWCERYARRVEDGRLPRAAAEREAYARAVGEDGFALLDRLDRPETAAELRGLPKVAILRQVWARHFVREDGAPPGGSVRLRAKEDPPPPEAEPVESPYDTEARFRTRSGTSWIGYVVHLSESCEDDGAHLITHAMTTIATVHEARCTAVIHQALLAKGLVPAEHLVDAAYVDAELLVGSRGELGIDLVGPPRPNPSWQGKVEGGHTIDRFEVDWDERRVRCPQGKLSSAWSPQVDHAGAPYVSVMFRKADCGACPARSLCTRAGHQARHLKLPPRAEHEALKAARERLATKEGRRRHARRAGIEGTISQGVRAFGLRRSRYRGLAKTHLQHVATAAAINVERLTAWFRAVPRAATRTSRLAALAAAA